MNAQTWLDDGLLCATKWHLWPSQPLTFDSGLTLTPEQTRYTVALNPFVRACVGKSRAEKVVCPLHPGTHRERMDPLGGLLKGERIGHRGEDHVERGRGGEERRWQCKRLLCLHPSRGTSSPLPVMNCKWILPASHPEDFLIFLKIMFIMLTFYTEYLADVLCLTKRAAWNIMHCTDCCIPECSALDFPIQCDKLTTISQTKMFIYQWIRH